MDEHGAAGSVRAEVGRSLALPRRRPVAVGDAHWPANAGAATKTAAATTSTCVSEIVSHSLRQICPYRVACSLRPHTSGFKGSRRIASAMWDVCGILDAMSHDAARMSARGLRIRLDIV